MVLDYRGVVFSFQNRKLRRRRQRLKLALLALLVAAACVGYRYVKTSAALGDIQDLLLDGRVEPAEKKLEQMGTTLFRRASLRELRALSELFAGRLARAQAQFRRLGPKPAATGLRSVQFQKHFLDRAEYRKLAIYNEYLLPRGGDENAWFEALQQAAFFNGPEAEKSVARLSPAFRQANSKALALLAKVVARLQQGRCDYIFDKHGLPLAYFDVRQQSTRVLFPGLDLSDFHAQLKEGLRYFRLTLDAGLQRRVDHLFKDFFGTLLVLDLPENSMAVVYSKSRHGGAVNAVFTERYEPGAPVAIVSLLAYLRAGQRDLFPYTCPGRITLTNKDFRDGAAHRRVADSGAALAVSCRLSFARLGLAAGYPSLAALFEKLHFNAPPFNDWFLTWRSGNFRPASANDFELANLAAGLEGISLTTVHGAVLAAVFSQNGLFYPPHVIDGAENILGLGFYNHAARPQPLLADDMNFMRVKKAMAGARVRPDSRAAIAGGRGRGPDEVFIGFFPHEKPRYAFAFRLQGAGKADSKAVSFLQDLVQILSQQ